MLFVPHAPLEKLQAYKRRMGWSFPWASDGDSGFIQLLRLRLFVDRGACICLIVFELR